MPQRSVGDRLAAHQHRLRLLTRHLCGRALRQRIEVDDVVQEVFLRALAPGTQLPDDTAGDEALWHLLARIARNTVVDIARAARACRRDGQVRRLERSDWTRFERIEPQALTPGPATRAQTAETEAALEAAFDALDAEHRRVIGLRQFEGLSAAETARRMGRSEAAIHSLYRRALGAWHEGLDPD